MTAEPLELNVRPLEAHLSGETARLFTDAFVDDPALLGTGPDHRPARWRVLQRYHELTLRGVLDGSGPQWCAMSQNSLVGAAVTLPAHTGTAFPVNALREGLLFLPAGLAPALRRAKSLAVTECGYPREPHVLLLFLASRHDLRGRGIGATLLQRVIEDARQSGLPLALDTTRHSNVAFYERFGFELIGEAALSRGARVWFMVHDGSWS